MIRELQKADIDKVADIWLNTNVYSANIVLIVSHLLII